MVVAVVVRGEVGCWAAVGDALAGRRGAGRADDGEQRRRGDVWPWCG